MPIIDQLSVNYGKLSTLYTSPSSRSPGFTHLSPAPTPTPLPVLPFALQSFNERILVTAPPLLEGDTARSWKQLTLFCRPRNGYNL